MPRLKHYRMALTLCGLFAAPCIAPAQSAPDVPARATTRPASNDFATSTVVTRMMAFDKNHDGKLTKDEVTDERLQGLFDQADTNADGIVTKEELMALAARLDADANKAGAPRGPGGRGGPEFGGGRPGGGRFGGPPQPGQILPPFVREELKLTAEQESQLDALEAEVKRKLAGILTAEQNKQLSQMHPGRPEGGSPGGPPR